MTLGQKIRRARIKRELTQDQVAKRLGVSRNAVSMWEKDKNHPRGRRLRQLAEELGLDVNSLLTGATQASSNETLATPRPVRVIPVVGIAAAGVWREGAIMQDVAIAEVPAIVAPQYWNYNLFGWEVSGDSMNLAMPGATHCYGILYSDLGRGPKDGELVVLERTHAGQVELSVKRCRVVKGQFTYWNESSNPHWKSKGPISLAHRDEDTLVVAKAWVIGWHVSAVG